MSATVPGRRGCRKPGRDGNESISRGRASEAPGGTFHDGNDASIYCGDIRSGIVLAAAGCATHDTAVDATGAAAIPTPDWKLSGTWHGSSYPLGTASTHYGSSLTFRFEDDGTWKATETFGSGRVVQYSGRARVRRNEVVLEEDSGRRFGTLRRTGDRLYGMETMRDAGRVMIELTRVP
jgi:hypothetical protein